MGKTDPDSLDRQVTRPPAAGNPPRSIGQEPTLGPSPATGDRRPEPGAQPERISIGQARTQQPGEEPVLGVVDRYELLGKLGEGGFGAVYRARDTVGAIEVAVKALPPLVAHNAEELARVRTNFGLVAKLAHPNIATVRHLHAVEKAGAEATAALALTRGDYLVVMECVHGSTLSAWRHQFPDSRVPVGLAVGITAQIAAALDHAHSQKIIHRDIKPANVMLLGARSAQVPSDQSDRSDASDGPARTPPQVKVLDFGLAAEIRSSMSRVSKEVTDTAGIRPYMAPEQWLGEAQGPATDQYGLAVLFYELVSGAVPFTSAFETNDSAIMLNVVRTQTPAALPQLSKAQNLALLRAFAKDPSQRFGSCAEFIAALGGAKVAGPRPLLPPSHRRPCCPCCPGGPCLARRLAGERPREPAPGQGRPGGSRTPEAGGRAAAGRAAARQARSRSARQG